MTKGEVLVTAGLKGGERIITSPIGAAVKGMKLRFRAPASPKARDETPPVGETRDGPAGAKKQASLSGSGR